MQKISTNKIYGSSILSKKCWKPFRNKKIGVKTGLDPFKKEKLSDLKTASNNSITKYQNQTDKVNLSTSDSTFRNYEF